MQTLPFPRTHAGSPPRRLAAFVLWSASAALARLAQRLLPPRRRRAARTQLEYHADAGAPEGALYVDGLLVGYIEGVKRL